jgi:hypothetical protein
MDIESKTIAENLPHDENSITILFLYYNLSEFGICNIGGVVDEYNKINRKINVKSTLESKVDNIDNYILGKCELFDNKDKSEFKKIYNKPKTAKKFYDVVKYAADLAKYKQEYALSSVILNNKNEYMILPKSTILYHGSSLNIQGFGDGAYCSFSPNLAFFYAVRHNYDNIYHNRKSIVNVYHIKPNRPLTLFIISDENLDNIILMYPYTQKLINRIFPRGSRVSDSLSDSLFSLFLCRILKVDGYIAPLRNGFHPEVMLCSEFTIPRITKWDSKLMHNWFKKMPKKNMKKFEILINFYANLTCISRDSNLAR